MYSGQLSILILVCPPKCSAFVIPLQLPVDCGSDGTTPTGTAPAIYMRNDINAYGTNAGTGGNFDTNGAQNIIEGRLIGYYPLT